MMGLELARKTCVDLLSGGQTKCLTIALQLISNPSLLICDEPLSGLDIVSSSMMTNLFKSMTKKGFTVIMSVHQPSSAIFAMFDGLILIIDGNVVYSGLARDALYYFKTLKFKCDKQFNPADFIMGLAIQEQREGQGQTEFKNRLLKEWQLFTKGKDVSAPGSDQEKKLLAKCKKAEGRREEGEVIAPWLWQCFVLTQREFFRLFPVVVNYLDVIQTIALALLIGVTFFRLPRTDTQVKNLTNGLFLQTYHLAGFYPLFQWMNCWGTEKNTILHECESSTYSLSAYFVSSTIALLPLSLLHPFFGSMICFWMLYFNVQASAYFLFFLVLWLGHLCGINLGRLISFVFAPNVILTINGAVLANLHMILSAYLVYNFPVWLEWNRWINYCLPVLQSVFLIAFNNDNVWTAVGEYNEFSDSRTFGGREILEKLKVAPFSLWNCILLIVCWTLALITMNTVLIVYWQPRRCRPQVAKGYKESSWFSFEFLK
eukprot:TRINITY_DN10388_c0_g1_i4.p1 TRINITY_DN10388_c0_g1~~TRINITY_DN10388_c0_g1_i4.p1  ORF type:complete len:487 (-),score=82.27 TRINITY_DN10388_c0_g1_i4:191-1651(-)